MGSIQAYPIEVQGKYGQPSQLWPAHTYNGAHNHTNMYSQADPAVGVNAHVHNGTYAWVSTI